MTKARVGDNNNSWILPVGLLTLGGVGLWWLFSKGPLSGTNAGIQQGNDATAAANQQGTAATAAQQAAKGQTQTLSPDAAAAIANQVYSIGQSGSSVDCQAMAYQIMQVNNLSDLNAVIAAFGTRSAVTGGGLDCSLLGLNCAKIDFASFVRLVLNSSDCSGGMPQGWYLNDINSYLTQMGINFQF